MTPQVVLWPSYQCTSVCTGTHRHTITHRHDIFHSSVCCCFPLFLPSVKKERPILWVFFCWDWGYSILLNQWLSGQDQQDHRDSEKCSSQVHTFPRHLKLSLRIYFSKSFPQHYAGWRVGASVLNCSWHVTSFPSQLYTYHFFMEI